MAKIKKGDLVVVISGRDKGQTGRVLEVLVETQRVVVEGVQRVTKHVKAGQTARGTRTEEIERDGRTRTVRVRVAKRSGKDV